MKNKKNILIVLGIFLLILVVGGVTYAFFSYSRVGETNTIVTGSLYLNFEQDNQVVLDTLFPEDEIGAKNHTSEDNTITFTVNGYTETVDRDIIYGIKLEDGDVLDGKTRIDSESLRFDLEEIVDGNTRLLINNANYADYRNGYIYVDRIEGTHAKYGTEVQFIKENGNEKMVIEDVVTSGLKIKDTITPEMIQHCKSMIGSDKEDFCAGTGTYMGYTIYDYAETDADLVLEYFPDYVDMKIKETITPEMIEHCMGMLGSDKEDFCAGTGTYMDMTIYDALIEKPDLVRNYFPDYIDDGTTTEYKYYKIKDTITQSMQNECISYLNDDYYWREGETVESFCAGTGTRYGSPLQFELYYEVFRDRLPSFYEEVPASQVYTKYAFIKEPITQEMIDSCIPVAYGLIGLIGRNQSYEEFCNGGYLDGKSPYSELGNRPQQFISILPNYVELIDSPKKYSEKEEIERIYKLRVWMDDEVTISDTNDNADYTTSEWNKLYASIKIRVDGDFAEKEQMEPISANFPESCFNYELIDNNQISITGFSSSCRGKNPVLIPSTIDGHLVTKIGSWAFRYNRFSNVIIPSSVIEIGANAFADENDLESVTIKGHPTIGKLAFNVQRLTTFKYGGTCNLLENSCNTSGNVCYGEEIFSIGSITSNRPNLTIITSDRSSCQLTDHYIIAK